MQNPANSPAREPSTSINTRAASVEFSDVSKVYPGNVKAVDTVSLKVEAGELVTLLGPSGCGKTTTLRMIAGLEKVSSGSIFIGEQEVTQLPATDRDVTMVFQSYALFPHMSVFDNVAYGLRILKLSRAELKDRTEAGLALVGLSGYNKRLPSELSGGQQQRVAVARALVLEPQVLLFDEPLSNLDAKLRRQVREEIRDIQQRLGLTVVYVTHDQEEALAVSDRIIVMNNATIAQFGTPRELYDAPVSEFVADFIGEANVLDANIDAVNDDIANVSVGNYQLQLNSGGLQPGAVKLAVRPHQIKLMSVTETNSISGWVEKCTYVGSHMEYRIKTDFGDMFVIDSQVNTHYQKGLDVGISFMNAGPVLLPG